MDLSTRTFRELIIELTHIEDSLRGALPVTLPDQLRGRVLARQEEICAELRRRSGPDLGPAASAELVMDEDPLLPEPA